MKRILLGAICLICILPLLAGCNHAPGAIETNLGEEFTLSIGQEARITGENLRIAFEDVIEDSRCPLYVTCIWEGRASILVQMTYDDSTYKLVLNEPGMTDHAVDMFHGYSIDFHLKPYPGEAESISKEDYLLQLTVGRQEQSSPDTED